MISRAFPFTRGPDLRLGEPPQISTNLDKSLWVFCSFFVVCLAVTFLAGYSCEKDDEYSYVRSIESWQDRETRRPAHKGPYVEPDMWDILEIYRLHRAHP